MTTGEQLTSYYTRWQATWRPVLNSRPGDLDAFQCVRCGHFDDFRREAHYAHCPYLREEKAQAKP